MRDPFRVRAWPLTPLAGITVAVLATFGCSDSSTSVSRMIGAITSDDAGTDDGGVILPTPLADDAPDPPPPCNASCYQHDPGQGPPWTRGTVKAIFEPLAPPSKFNRPFPIDVGFVVSDPNQITGLRVNMPPTGSAKWDQDLVEINKLDGSNPKPRLGTPIDGDVDVGSLDDNTVFLMPLTKVSAGGVVTPHPDRGRRIPCTDFMRAMPGASSADSPETIYGYPTELLEEDTRYAYVWTTGVKDTSNNPLAVPDNLWRFRHDLSYGQTGDLELARYRDELLDAYDAAAGAGLDPNDLAMVSVFTTRSITNILTAIRNQIEAAPPPSIDFNLEQGGPATIYPLASITSITAKKQTSSINQNLLVSPVDAPPGNLTKYAMSYKDQLTKLIPNTVGTVAFARFVAPDYLDSNRSLPLRPTLEEPQRSGDRTVYVDFYLPKMETKPVSGFPLVIIHAGNSASALSFMPVAPKMAEHGFAVAVLHTPCNAGGPNGRTTVTVNGAPHTFTLGADGQDINGDGVIADAEGRVAAGANILGDSGMAVQIAVNILALERILSSVPLDLDGDGAPDIDSSSLSFFSFSNGAGWGSLALPFMRHVDRAVLAETGVAYSGVLYLPNANGRATVANPLSQIYGLLNPPGTPVVKTLGGLPVLGPWFNEEMQLDHAPIANPVAGAPSIREYIDDFVWFRAHGRSESYARYLTRAPLPGMNPKSMLMEVSTGDQTVAVRGENAFIRAGALESRTTQFRFDLFFAASPTLESGFWNPHSILAWEAAPPVRSLGYAMQEQFATFLETGQIIDPDGAGPYFETPAQTLYEQIWFAFR
jgi:hypothetical protein